MPMPTPTPRPGILDIAPYVGGKSKPANGLEPIKLSSNENPLGASKDAIEAYLGEAARMSRYPDGGAAELRRALARRFDLDPERIVCGAGSDELIALLVRAYAGPDDEVLYSRHGFLMYRLAALAAGAHPVAAPETGLKADVDALLARVTARTKLVFLANPNNPTGSYLSKTELERLHAGLPGHVVLVVDAAYAEYVEADDYANGQALALAHDNVVMTRTFSKLFGLAGLRLGWMLASPDIVDVVNRVRGPFNLGGPALAAGVAALADRDHQRRSVAHNAAERERLAAGLTGLGIEAHASVGNFVLAGFADAKEAAAANAYLEGRGILVRAMDGYGLPHCLRISVGLEAENTALLDALRDFMAGQTLGTA